MESIEGSEAAALKGRQMISLVKADERRQAPEMATTTHRFSTFRCPRLPLPAACAFTCSDARAGQRKRPWVLSDARMRELRAQAGAQGSKGHRST
jgi:hypothetical protein